MEQDSEDTLLIPGQRIRPPGSKEIASNLLKKLYGFEVTSVTELNAYDDRNYHILCKESHTNPYVSSVAEDGYVLKIVNSLDSRKSHVIEGQTEMLIFLNQRGINCPLPVKNIYGQHHSLCDLRDEQCTGSYAVRLLLYRPGELLHRVTITIDLLRNVGQFTARLDKVLKSFSHSAYDDHKTLWMLNSVPKLRQFTYAVKNESEKELVHQVIFAFENDVLRIVNELEEGMIHGDLNEQNLVMSSDGKEICAVIDFGDSHRTCLIFELAIVLCYMILQTGDETMGKCVLEGYENVRKLTNLEKNVLKVTVCARICQSLVLGAYSHLHDPGNEYVLTTQKPGWILLKKLWPLKEEVISRMWGLYD